MTGEAPLPADTTDTRQAEALREELTAFHEKMRDIINAIPGGAAIYRVSDIFETIYFSDGVPELAGYTAEEYRELVKGDALNRIYEPDRPRVQSAVRAALVSGAVLDISYRMRHKDGSLIWIHLSGRRVGPLSEDPRFYAVFTGMSSETRLFQSIVNEAADSVYVIDRESYELLYVNESKKLFNQEGVGLGQKCYAALHGRDAPCGFCTLKTHGPDGKEHQMVVSGTDRSYRTRFREVSWNGIPAYLKYVRDVTDAVKIRREKERLEQYFQTVVKNLPGGVAVVRYESDGGMRPEFLSDGFAAMTGMTLEEAWDLYRRDAMAGVHPEDQACVRKKLDAYIAGGESRCELLYRLRKGGGGYLWVKNTLTLIQNEGGESRVYAVYQDMTKEREEQERLRRQYKELILHHYSSPEPNALIMGHCNITQNRISEIMDYTNSNLLETFGGEREVFFTGVAGLIVDEGERQTFLDTYLNEPSLRAFAKGVTELIQNCFVRLPREETGRFVQFKVGLIKAPDSEDITGILTVTDITEQTISERIMGRLSVASYDLVIDLDLKREKYTVLSGGGTGKALPLSQGPQTDRAARFTWDQVVPRDRKTVSRMLDRAYMLERLEREGSYSFSYSLTGEEIQTKTLTVLAIDLRLGRICLSRTDITDSMREQQALLRVIAYTFELAGFLDIDSRRLTLYTRQTVLGNLPPHDIERYDDAIARFVRHYSVDQSRAETQKQFQVDTMLRRLGERPAGYGFLLSYQAEGEERYKQIDVMWGGSNHKTICLVRADVTDMLRAERQNKRELEEALVLTEEANRAKSDFLSAMSHDIRTPMNAIMGMTALATAHLDDRERVADCLRKISVSSRHLLSLINDILDMSKIERSKITLSRVRISIPELLEQLNVMMWPQARSAGLAFDMRVKGIQHQRFYGDALRISQILINILSNAIKYTPEGGSVAFLIEELPAREGAGRVRYRFTVRDTGVGMPAELTAHVFAPFNRGSGTARIEGTGLGLSITKGLVDLMGGVISVESEVGAGSIFRVELECEGAPDTPELSTRREEAPAGGPAGQGIFAGRRVLIAEDNAINAEILCGLLELFGVSAVVRTDGAKAVREFQNTAPGTYDAVLMDIQMPEMNGYEATRAIRKTPRSDAAVIPVIAMTANAFAEDVQASLEAGMTAHVAKPIDVDMLRGALSRAWRGQSRPHGDAG